MAKAIINCNTQGAEIRYTTDNSEVNEESPVYSGQLNIEAGTTVKAKAFKLGMNPSNQVSLKSLDKLQTPTLTHSRNASTINISIGNTVSGATYRYKVGSAPESPTDGTAITSTATLDDSSAVTIYVKGWYTGTYNPSDTAMDSVEQYVQPKCATPIISQSGNTVTITCSTSGATIYYKQGSSGSYSAYSGSFTITATTTVYAYATAPDYIQSDEVSQNCVFENLKLPTPVITQGEGGYTESAGNYAIITFVNGDAYAHLRSTLKIIISKTYMDAYLELIGFGSSASSLETDESGNYIFNVNEWGENFLSANSNFGEYIINDEVPTFSVKFRNVGYEDSEWGSCTYQIMKLKTPTLSLSRSGLTVNGTVGNREALAIYRYKVGSAPTSKTDGSAVSSKGTFSFTNEHAITVYVRGFKDGYTMSDAVLDSVNAGTPKCATPTISQSGNAVTFRCSTSGATIHYSGCGKSGTCASGGSVEITESGTMTAYATASGYTQSDTASRSCTYSEIKPKCATPEIQYAFNLATFFCDTKGAIMNISGCGLSIDDGRSGDGFPIKESGTITVYATATGYSQSETVSLYCEYKDTLDTPVIEIGKMNLDSSDNSINYRVDLLNFESYPVTAEYDIEIYNVTTEKLVYTFSHDLPDGPSIASGGAKVENLSVGDTVRITLVIKDWLFPNPSPAGSATAVVTEGT